MNDRIQTWSSILLGAAVVVLVGWLTMQQLQRSPLHHDADAGASATSDASASSTSGATASGGTTASDSGSAAVDLGAGLGASAGTSGGGSALGTLDTDGGFALGNLGALLPDGGAMPTGAPRTVRLGVVLVQWAGAEGASSSARAKPDALKHAQQLVEQARTDWKAAVKAGDSGSSEDIGRVPRGVLDARTEVAVFSMSKDEISEPLETPRGYWIVKRVE